MSRFGPPRPLPPVKLPAGSKKLPAGAIRKMADKARADRDQNVIKHVAFGRSRRGTNQKKGKSND